MKGLRYSPLHMTELCGEMQGKFKVGHTRLITIPSIKTHQKWFLFYHLHDLKFKENVFSFLHVKANS